MQTLTLHNVDQDVYDALDVLELHGATTIWKQLRVQELEIVFFPGEWRHADNAAAAAAPELPRSAIAR